MGVIFRNGKPYGGAASSTDEIYYIDDKGNKITLTEEIEVLKQSCQYDLDSKIDKTEKGSKNGVAELDGTGKVPSDQLPSYVDDVIEGYYNSNDENFYLDEEYTENIKGEEGKIYIDLITNGSYRYAIKSNKFIKITSGYIGGKTDYGTIIIDGNSILLDQAVGMSTESHEYEIDGEVISSKNGAEIFNDYQHNIALGDYSHAEGSETIASGPYSHSEGVATVANTHGAHAEGTATTASGTSSHAEGNVTIASGTSSHAEGHDTVASATCSHAEGQNTSALGTESHAEGFGTKASGHCSHSEGIHTIASSDYQHVQGKYNVEDAEDKYAFIIGNGTSNDNRSNAIAIDWDGNILCYGDEISINEQIDNNTRKLSGIDDNANNYIHPTHTSHSKGMYKFANDEFGHVSDAEEVTKQDIVDLGIPGQDTKYTGGSTDFGTITVDNNTIKISDAVGISTAGKTYTIYDVEVTAYEGAEIFNNYERNIASGHYSHAEGSYTEASGHYSHAEGFSTEASGGHSHVEGSTSSASGDCSHAEGFNTHARGSCSHTEGCNVEAIGSYSHAEGKSTIAKSDFQHVLGKYNFPDSNNKYVFIIGNGTDNNDLSNAIAIDWDGNIFCYGDKTSLNAQIDANTKKLSGIAANANNYVHPTTSGNKHIPSGGSSGQILRWSADGTAVWGADNNTTYSDATQSTHGLMTAADKKKLDSLSHAESISSLVFKNNSSKTYMGIKFSSNRVSARFLVMENNGRRADIYVSFRIDIDTKATVYASCDTDTEFRIFYDNEGYIYVVFNCSAWSRASCISTIENALMTEWNGTSYPSNLTAIATDIRYTLDSVNFTNYALAKDGTAKKAETLPDSGWRTLADKVKYRKIGNIVEVRGTYTAPNSGGGMTIGTLPSGYRPSNSSVYNTNSIESTASEIYYTSVSTAGVVIISGMSGSTFTQGTAYNVNIMFMVG